MASCVAVAGGAYIVEKLPKKEEQKQYQQQAKNEYWQNELSSLGILEPNAKKKNLTVIKKNFVC